MKSLPAEALIGFRRHSGWFLETTVAYLYSAVDEIQKRVREQQLSEGDSSLCTVRMLDAVDSIESLVAFIDTRAADAPSARKPADEKPRSKARKSRKPRPAKVAPT